jgi:hypothetical protein
MDVFGQSRSGVAALQLSCGPNTCHMGIEGSVTDSHVQHMHAYVHAVHTPFPTSAAPGRPAAARLLQRCTDICTALAWQQPECCHPTTRDTCLLKLTILQLPHVSRIRDMPHMPDAGNQPNLLEQHSPWVSNMDCAQHLLQPAPAPCTHHGMCRCLPWGVGAQLPAHAEWAPARLSLLHCCTAHPCCC